VGVNERLGYYCKELGTKALVVTDRAVLRLIGDSDELYEVIGFCESVGLPITAKTVKDPIVAADALGQDYREDI